MPSGRFSSFEHRALLDMHLDKTEVARRVAALGGDGLQRAWQAGGQHGLAHRDAVGVALIQPGGVEAAGERRPSPGRWRHSAGPLLRQRPPARCQTASGGRCDAARAPPHHRHEDAQPAVVHFRRCARVSKCEPVSRRGASGIAAVEHARHIAHRVDAHLVEAALVHPQQQLLLAGLVRGRQVGDGELAGLCKGPGR